MKQKILGRGHKNFDLNGMRDIHVFSKSWAKYSFIELLVTLLPRTKDLIDFFYFRILRSLCISRNPQRNSRFVRKTSMLLALFFLIPFFCSGNGAVERIKLDVVQRRTKGYYSIFRRDALGEESELIPESNLSKHLFDFSLYANRMIDQDSFWLWKAITKNLRNWGEPDETLVRSLLSLKEKKNSYLLNRLDSNLYQSLMNHSQSLRKLQHSQNHAGHKSSDEIRDPKSLLDVENSLSDSVYMTSRYFLHGAEKCDYRMDNIPANNCMGAGSVRIVSIMKVARYYARLLRNYSFPPNTSYNILCKAITDGREEYYTSYKRWEQLLLKAPYMLLRIRHVIGGLDASANRLDLKRDLIGMNNQLNLSMDRSLTRDFHPLLLLLLPNRDANNSPNYEPNTLMKNPSPALIYIELANHYDSIRKDYKKYFRLLSNNSYLERIFFLRLNRNREQKSMIHEYLIIEEAIKGIYSIDRVGRYARFISGFYCWISGIQNCIILEPLEGFVLNSFFTKIESFKSLEPFSSNRISNPLRILARTFGLFLGHNRFFHKFERYVGQKSKNLCLNQGNGNEWIINDEVNAKANSLIEFYPMDTFSNHETNRSVPMPRYGISYTKYFRSVCNKRFFFHSEEVNTWNCNIVYSKILRDLLESNGFVSIITEDNFWRETSSFVKSLFGVSLSGIFHINFGEIRSIFFPEVHYQSFIKCAKISFFEFFGVMTVPHGEVSKKPYYDVLHHEAVVRNRNGATYQLVATIPSRSELGYSGCKNSKYEVGRGITANGKTSYGYSRVRNPYLFTTSLPFGKYTAWFFTPEWWEYYTHLVIEILREEVFSVINYYFEHLKIGHIQILKKNQRNLEGGGNNSYDLDFDWKSSFLFDPVDKIIANFLWLKPRRFINNWNGLHWAGFTLVFFVLLSYQHFFAISTGSNFLYLWKHFETIQYLTDASRAFYPKGSIHFNETGSNKIENSVIHFLENLRHCTRNIRFYLLTKKGLDGWVISNKSLDLSRRERNLLVQALIMHTRLKRYGFYLSERKKQLNNRLGYRITNHQGLAYVRYLSVISRKNFVNYQLQLADKWIHLASLQKIISPQIFCREDNLNNQVQRIPVPLRFGLSRPKGFLLIGPIETGRSYLIKDLAADSCAPLLGIHMDRFIYNKPDAITESWINILIESLRRLNLILDLAEGISPCIVWIRNIHRLDVNPATRSIESEPTFLLGILLKHFQTDSIKTQTDRNRIIIGSTHLPARVDPALISANRLDRIINIRLPSNCRRRNEFFALLSRNSICLKNKLLHLAELDSRTAGYNARDLAALTNEVSLISITRNKSLVNTDTTEFAFHRQILRSTHANNQIYSQQNFEISLYKIGRAIIRNTLIGSSITNPLSISNYSWRQRFYYLSKWYLEPSIDSSIAREFTILTHILGCLAGIAARDSWFLLEQNSDASIPLDKSIENDLSLAFSILGSLTTEFPWLEICETRNQREIGTQAPRHSPSIVRREVFVASDGGTTHARNGSGYVSWVPRRKLLDERDFEFRSTAWSSRSWRLSFSRSYLFDWIQNPNASEFLRGFKSSGSLIPNSYPNKLMETGKEQLIYERILPRVKKRNVQELEYRFEQILLEEQSKVLGFFRPTTQYPMEYEGDNEPRLFVGERILWNPMSSCIRIRNSIFSRREFFIDEEMLRRLHVTYGVRRERERSVVNNKVKQFFLRRGYNKELIDKLSSRWWNRLRTDEGHSIDTWKRIEEIGIRLRRPQVFTPVYLYQRWLIENLPEKLPRFELSTQQQRWLEVTNPSLTDSLVYRIISESYQYLLEFFLSEKVLLDRATSILLAKKWLPQSEIGYLIRGKGN